MSALAELKTKLEESEMTTVTEKSTTTQVYRVYIKATPEAIWEAITNPEWTEKYGYGGRSEYDLRPGGTTGRSRSEEMKAYGGPDVIVDGEVIECDPPRKLVQTWRALWDPAMVAEGFKRLTWEIEPGKGGVTTLTVTHELDGAPKTAAQVPARSRRPAAAGASSSAI